jgi:flagellar basal-body rod protein FlgB
MQAGFLNFYDGVLSVSQERASLLTNNVANADTPGFKAMDVKFEAALASQLAAGAGGASADGTAAIDAPPAVAADADAASADTTPLYRASATVGLNGNDVSLDGERVEAAKNGEQMAAAATFLHQSTADLITALRPNPSGN